MCTDIDRWAGMRRGERERKTYYKELTHTIMEAGKSHSLQGSRRANVQVSSLKAGQTWGSKKTLRKVSESEVLKRLTSQFNSQGAGVLFHPAFKIQFTIVWMRPTYIREGSLLCSVYQRKCWNLSRNTSTATLRTRCLIKSWAPHGPVKKR